MGKLLAISDPCKPSTTGNIPNQGDPDCDSYIVCLNGAFQALVPCVGQRFNPSTGTCDHTVNVPCAGAPTTTTTAGINDKSFPFLRPFNSK